MKKKSVLSVILVVVSIGLAVFAFFILPDTVIIQFSFRSSGNATAPKLLAILIPTALGVGGSVSALFSKEDKRAFGKSILVSIVGVFCGIFMIVVNTLMV